jgi:hypothetical protein
MYNHTVSINVNKLGILTHFSFINSLGAQEQMDVSTDDSPGYVSIKTKGPGKPIIIRSDGS